ncbi:glycerol kinase GlpK [Ferroplasma sp.]|uniref:FGGY family carbohydrate kinase n=1 Tax=Ferroplasma sp. TaxID=2591003 RepID=UPI00307FAEE0
MAEKYILSIDAGTTNCKAVIFDSEGKIKSRSATKMISFYPEDGSVEQNPYFIISAVKKTINEALKLAKLEAKDMVAAGITNQRETAMVWDRNTGIPVYNAIVWQDRRTEKIMKSVAEYTGMLREKTGLRPDPYFSAGKIQWILDNVGNARVKAKNNELIAGTVDSWLLYNLGNKKPEATDYTNASRTMLFNIHKLEWDNELLELFNIPESMLAETKPSLNEYGTISIGSGTKIPVYSIIGDQQSALFGHGAIFNGMGKTTYGTGAFVLANTGNELPDPGPLTGTIAYALEEKRASYAIEGSIFSAGAAIEWVKKLLKVNSYEKLEEMAGHAENLRAILVPAFTGLGSPYWDPDARGIISGINYSTGRNEMARMAYESVAYQVQDVLHEIEKIMPVNELKVDGGLTRSDFLMQLQANLSDKRIIKTENVEVTAAGAAYIAGIVAGFWNINKISSMPTAEKIYFPQEEKHAVKDKYVLWQRAVLRALEWKS